jgi:hypothetical protein
MVQEPLLAQGYALATSTFNIFQNNCNDRISAETLSMVKEHFIKAFGSPVHTLGLGGSGGSVQVHLIAQNYPGLLDGIIVYSSFPDQMSGAHTSSITDCPLLDHAFQTSKSRWREEQKTAVSGFATWRTCVARVSGVTHVEPRGCDRSMPKDAIYDPDTNPNGARCDLYDNEINVLGRDPRTGNARRPLDSVGVQYGLVAFNAGKIDAEHFIELNERVGGYDEDGNIVSTRTEADPQTIRIAYERGLVLTGGGGLSQIPIIDWRQYADDMADIHVRFESFATRARLIEAGGNTGNQVILVDPRVDFMALLNPDPATSVAVRRQLELVRQMDHWQDNIAADSTPGPAAEKVARDRPADLSDGCWATDGEKIVEPATFDGIGRCNKMYPSYGDPRLAAGAPLTDDILKCALKPISAVDYSQAFTASQLERLRAVFPTGVCDYSRPGVGQQLTQNTWQRYDLPAIESPRPTVTRATSSSDNVR